MKSTFKVKVSLKMDSTVFVAIISFYFAVMFFRKATEAEKTAETIKKNKLRLEFCPGITESDLNKALKINGLNRIIFIMWSLFCLNSTTYSAIRILSAKDPSPNIENVATISCLIIAIGTVACEKFCSTRLKEYPEHELFMKTLIEKFNALGL